MFTEGGGGGGGGGNLTLRTSRTTFEKNARPRRNEFVFDRPLHYENKKTPRTPKATLSFVEQTRTYIMSAGARCHVRMQATSIKHKA